MSTRTQIEFITDYSAHDNADSLEHRDMRTVYRHSDGYPSAMIPDLLHFIRWNYGRNTDVEYTAANWIYWNKRNEEEEFLNPDYEVKRRGVVTWDNSDTESDHNSILKIGHGVCNNGDYHGDIEYLYKVMTRIGHINLNGYTTIDVFAVERFGDPCEFRLLGTIQVPDDLSDENINMVTKEFLQSIHADD